MLAGSQLLRQPLKSAWEQEQTPSGTLNLDELLDPSARTCKVYCVRFASFLPLFICDGGNLYNCDCPNGSGLFVIPSCVIK